MAVDERTANLNLPKVHPDNNMRNEDVPRLQQFADDVDAALIERPTQADVTAEIGAAVAPKANTSALSGYTPTSRRVNAGTGLDGGGAFTSDVTLSLDAETIASLALAGTAVQPSRTLFAGTGLTGGGNLSANRTIALSAGSIASMALADTAVQPARRVDGGSGLTGGGALSGDVELGCDFATEAEALGGANDSKPMNALRSRQLVDQRPPGIPVAEKAAAHTLAATDKGYTISITTGGVTAPAGLEAGFAATIYNNSASDQTITQGSGLTLRLAGGAETGNRTLAGYGVCTVLYLSSGLAVISGVGLS